MTDSLTSKTVIPAVGELSKDYYVISVADFKTVHRIAQHFRDCYRDGYRAGLTEARRALQAMERTA